MNAPTPTDSKRTDGISGDRPPHSDAEPIHSVTFRPMSAGHGRTADASPKRYRSWALAALLVLTVFAGGVLLHHLRQHPILAPIDAPVHRQESEPPVQAKTAVAPPKTDARQTPSIAPSTAAPTPIPAPEAPQAASPPAPLPTEEDARSIVTPIAEATPDPDKAVDAVQPKPEQSPTPDLLSQGLALLHSGQYRQARDALRQAAARDPASEAIREALSQVDQALKLAQLDRLQQQANAARGQGAWTAALEHYQAALAIDPNVRFALQGRQHVVRRITLAKRIDFYLLQPEALFGNRHLTNAVQLLAEAEAMEPKDQAFITMLIRLETAISEAQTPVPLSITSDGQTDVAVYRVGRLGRFEHRRLELKPGSYTVVGTRDGYRDVRLRLAVKPGAVPPAIRVVCKEAIQ